MSTSVSHSQETERYGVSHSSDLLPSFNYILMVVESLYLYVLANRGIRSDFKIGLRSFCPH